MTLLLKDAVNPNLVQTLEHSPALMHGGPFANIAHGCNSVRATKLALKLADITVTEAGFGSDLGAEKFLDIKCRAAGFAPNCVVVVATARALKYNGGVPKAELFRENLEALQRGMVNLRTHVENMQSYGLPVVVSLNQFMTDTEAELALIENSCAELGAPIARTEVFAKGGAGGEALAQLVCQAVEQPSRFRFAYDAARPMREKLHAIATKIYHADGVQFTTAAAKALERLEQLGYGGLPVCVAKTQYSLSDDPAKLGRPSNFTITVRDVYVSAGAGFVVCLTGDIMTMPGLPREPAACRMDIDDADVITGLF
jgi:formate--tetrahydrofolate ligase